MTNDFYASVGRELFGRLSHDYAKQLRRAGMANDPYEWVGGLATVTTLYALALALFSWVVLRFSNILLLIALIAGFYLLTILSINTWVASRVDDRKNKLERVIPDAFQIMAANMRSGMTPVAALRGAARPEFGPLEEEIKVATSKAMGTASFMDALNHMGDAIPSPVFQRSIALIAASLKGGGNLPKLLEGLATDIRENQALKQELDNSTSLYVLFILFTVILGTPLLLGISYQFTALITKIGSRTILHTSSQFGSLLSVPFTTQFVSDTSLLVITVTAVLAAMLIGTIREGRLISGLRYTPFILIGSLAAYFFLRDYVLRFVVHT